MNGMPLAAQYPHGYQDAADAMLDDEEPDFNDDVSHLEKYLLDVFVVYAILV